VTLRSDGDNDVGRRHNHFSVGDRKGRVLGHFDQKKQVNMKVLKGLNMSELEDDDSSLLWLVVR
jgi:hypothetical protein